MRFRVASSGSLPSRKAVSTSSSSSTAASTIFSRYSFALSASRPECLRRGTSRRGLSSSQTTRLHADEIDHALELVLGADRKLDRNRLGAEAIDDVLQAAVEIRASLVHLVGEDDARHLVLVALTPHRLGLRLNALVGIEHAYRAVEHAQRTLDFNREVDVAGGVDDVQPLAVPERGGRGRRDGDATLLLLLHEIHGRSAVVHFADLVALAGVIKNPLGGRGLAGVDMRHDPEVTVVFDGMLAGHLEFLVSVLSSPLPAIMRERAVGFRHLVHVFALLDRVPPIV